MKVATAIVVGLITFSYAGVASAYSRCAPSSPKSNSPKSSYVQQPSAIQMMLMMWRGY